MTGLDRIEPVWLDAVDARAIHDRQLAEHGGIDGVRDHTMLESALGRPRNKWGYGEDDVASLAAAYAFGMARNHPFADGNKRTAWILARLFVSLNGHDLRFEPAGAIATVQALAAGALDETELATWFRARIAPLA